MHYFIFTSPYPGSSLLSMLQMVRDLLFSDVCIQSPLIQRGWFMETHIFSKFSESHIYFYTPVLYMYISDLMILFHNCSLIMAVPVTSSSILLPSIHPSIHLSTSTIHRMTYILKLILNIQRAVRHSHYFSNIFQLFLYLNALCLWLYPEEIYI